MATLKMFNAWKSFKILLLISLQYFTFSQTMVANSKNKSNGNPEKELTVNNVEPDAGRLRV